MRRLSDEYAGIAMLDTYNVNDACDATDSFDIILNNSDRAYREQVGLDHSTITRYIHNGVGTEIYWYDPYYIYFRPLGNNGFHIGVYETVGFTTIDDEPDPILVFHLDYDHNFNVTAYNFEGLVNTIADFGLGDELNSICEVMTLLGLFVYRDRCIGFVYSGQYYVQPLMFKRLEMGY